MLRERDTSDPEIMGKIDAAVNALKEGKFILIHDSLGRENETDFVIAAEFITPNHIAEMRMNGGGLICIAISSDIGEKIGLPFATQVMESASKEFPILDYLNAYDIPYDEKSSFSLTINHRQTFTGITDKDRALTIRKFGELAGKLNPVEFGLRFRSPGHVPLLISRGLKNRRGHTELATAMLEMASLTQVAAICEMMDSKTHSSLSKEKALGYAKHNNMVFLEGDEIVGTYKG